MYYFFIEMQLTSNALQMMTPLLVAINRGDLEMAQLLIQSKADPNTTDRNVTCIAMAVTAVNAEVLRVALYFIMHCEVVELKW